MRFFKKFEVSKPRKLSKNDSECLSNGTVKPLKDGDEKLVKDESKDKEENDVNGVKDNNLKEEPNGNNNMGFEEEKDKKEEKAEPKANGLPEMVQTQETTECKNFDESTLINLKRKNSNEPNHENNKNEPSGRQSTWSTIYTKLIKVLDHPNIIHWTTLCLIGLAIWGVVYSIADSEFLPGSQLFSLLILFVVAFISGELMKLVKLPPLLGMLLMGILLRNVGFIHLQGIFMEVTATLREISLCIILIRAGLGLDPKALKSLCYVILRLASLPGIVELILTMIVTHFLLSLPWLWGMLLGAILAAVSPAVVIPCLFSLQENGYGTDKGISTLVVAAASLDDIFAITVFGVVLNMIYSSGSSLIMQVAQGPLGILIGIVFGLVWGLVANFVPHRKDEQVVLLRVLMIIGGGLVAIIGSGAIGYQGAGPLGCIVAAFIACLGWRKQDYSDKYNPVASVFKIIWVIFQPILFGLIGSEVDVSVLEFSTIGNGLIALFCSLLGRMVTSVFVGFGAGLNWKEKIFLALAWLPKATVQAALAPLVLDIARRKGSDAEVLYARKILVLAVLAILLTAPVGAALITTLGPKFLTKSDSNGAERARETEVNLEARKEDNSENLSSS